MVTLNTIEPSVPKSATVESRLRFLATRIWSLTMHGEASNRVAVVRSACFAWSRRSFQHGRALRSTAKKHLDTGFAYACSLWPDRHGPNSRGSKENLLAEENVGQTALHNAVICRDLNLMSYCGRRAQVEAGNVYGGTLLGQATRVPLALGFLNNSSTRRLKI
jgi:hypothetical protein